MSLCRYCRFWNFDTFKDTQKECNKLKDRKLNQSTKVSKFHDRNFESDIATKRHGKKCLRVSESHVKMQMDNMDKMDKKD